MKALSSRVTFMKAQQSSVVYGIDSCYYIAPACNLSIQDSYCLGGDDIKAYQKVGIIVQLRRPD